MKIHIDDIYDTISKIRMRMENDELTAEEALTLLEEELAQIEYEQY